MASPLADKKEERQDKDEQEVGPGFMITTAATVREVCVGEGGITKERAKSEDKGKRDKRQAAANRAKKKQNINN